jgi:hypothetical protein
MAHEHRSTPLTGVPLCGHKPRPGDVVWRGDQRGVIDRAGRWTADPAPVVGIMARLIAAVSTARHRRETTDAADCDCTPHDITTPGAAHADDCPRFE